MGERRRKERCRKQPDIFWDGAPLLLSDAQMMQPGPASRRFLAAGGKIKELGRSHRATQAQNGSRPDFRLSKVSVADTRTENIFLIKI